MIKHILLILLCCSSALAQIDKFQPVVGERAIGRYVVTIEDDSATVDVAQRARELAGAYGGRLEPYAGSAGTFAISMLPVRAKALSADPRVRSVVEVVPGGANPSAPAPVQEARVALTQPQHVKGNSYNATWESGQYSYDGAGNIVAIGSNTYLYDSANRLIKGTARTAGYGNMQCFSYDAFGNMRRIVTSLQSVPTCADITATTGLITVAGVNSANNRIDVAAPPATPANAKIEYGTFDDTGNQVSSDGVTQYAYDSMHRIQELTTPAQLRDETYLYDGSDDRVSTLRFSPAGQLVSITRTLRDIDGKVLRDVTQFPSGSGWTWQWLKDYVYRDGSLLAAVAAAPNNTTSTTHFHLDHLGSPRLITSDTGARLAQHAYMPFGEEAAGSDHDVERMKFTGAERDDDSTDGSLDYLHARFYSSSMGRFLSVDPIPAADAPLRPQHWNRFSYAYNRPLTYTDPTGLTVYSQLNAADSATLLTQLRDKTGLDLYFDKGVLQSHGQLNDAQGKALGSATARNDLLKAMAPDTTHIIQSDAHAWIGRNSGAVTKLNFADIAKIDTGRNAAGTFDAASILIHEMVGHGLLMLHDFPGNDPSFIRQHPQWKGDVVDHDNKIRSELGLPLRSQYRTEQDRLGRAYIPFANGPVYLPKEHQ